MPRHNTSPYGGVYQPTGYFKNAFAFECRTASPASLRVIAGEKSGDRSEDPLRIFQLRKMADIVQDDDIRARDQLPITLGHMQSTDRIERAADQAQRRIGRLQRTDPARTFASAFGHVTEQRRHRMKAFIVLKQSPVFIDRRVA